MIKDEKLQEIIEKLDTPADVKGILRDRLRERILRIRKQLNESEEMRFNILESKVQDESKDILSIIRLMNYLPAQVDVNRDYLVKYIWEIFKDEQK